MVNLGVNGVVAVRDLVLVVLALAGCISGLSYRQTRDTDPRCSGLANFERLPHDESCNKYYQCYGEQIFEMQCPDNTWFNSGSLICDESAPPEDCEATPPLNPDIEIEPDTSEEEGSEQVPELPGEAEQEPDTETEEVVDSDNEDSENQENNEGLDSEENNEDVENEDNDEPLQDNPDIENDEGDVNEIDPPEQDLNESSPEGDSAAIDEPEQEANETDIQDTENDNDMNADENAESEISSEFIEADDSPVGDENEANGEETSDIRNDEEQTDSPDAADQENEPALPINLPEELTEVDDTWDWKMYEKVVLFRKV